MLTVIIPTLNSESGLAACLTALITPTVEGIVREVVVVDGGSSDRTGEIIDQAGATLIRSVSGRGRQLAAGADQARMPWLLFLRPDTILEPGWEREASTFMERVDSGARPAAAAAFRFALDDPGVWPRLIEFGVAARCALVRMPYGNQGLLIPRRLYRQIGGYKPLSLMEDVDFMRRVGWRRTVILRARAISSAEHARRDGDLRNGLRNLSCLALHHLRVPPGMIARLYR
ncbi:MAG: glycosyltransferase [Hyphomicrobiaceae bacterium]